MPKVRITETSAKAIVKAAYAVATTPGATLEVAYSTEGMEGRRKKDYDRALSYLHDLNSRNDLVNQVFLGGSCDPTTWRRDKAIPLLEAEGGTYYNPQVDEWSEDLLAIEAEAKLRSAVLLFVLDSQTRALATLNEIIEFAVRGRQKVIVVMDFVSPGTEVEGQPLTPEEAQDINSARSEVARLARQHGAEVYNSLMLALTHVMQILVNNEEDHG